MTYNPLPQPATSVVLTGLGTSPVTFDNPFPVSLGSSTITIIGDITIPTTVSVASSPTNPVHTHITEVGTTDILDVPYLPVGISTLLNTVSIANTVSISNTSFYVLNPVTSVMVGGTVSIANTVSISNTSFYITGVGATVNVNIASQTGFSLVTINTGIGTSTGPVSIQNPLAVQVGFQTFGSNIIKPTSEYSPFPVYLPYIEQTSKNRLKISTYETSFFNTFQFNKETDIWSEKTTNGGSATFDSTVSGVVMSVTNQVGSEVIRQTKNVMRYIPGRTSTLSFAVRLENPVTGIRRRFGLFDDDNGVYFEDGGDGNYYCCIRNKGGTGGPTLERIGRSNWNGDKLDGYGVSGITASATAIQLINIEYEWYGAGQVVFSYIINGKSHIIHKFDNGNRLDHPWCSTPFLPIRLEITNVTGAAGTHYMYQGSNSVISEGVPEKLGICESTTNAGLGTDLVYKPLANAGQFYPMISIRLKPDQLSGVVLPGSFQAATIDNAGLGYKLIKNSNLVGAAFTNAPDSNAFTQIDVSATSFTGGDIIDSGFIVGGTSGGITINKDVALQLGRVGIGTTMTSDVLTLAVAYIAKSNSAKDAVASLTWIEQR